MSKYFQSDTTLGKEAECAICCCLWSDPVEVRGCGHIFCRGCVEGLKNCPSCNGPVDKLSPPNNAILRMLMRVRGGCSVCPWKGTYKEFKDTHKTCLKSGEKQPLVAEESCSLGITADSERRMQEYYMEGDNRPTGAAPPSGAGPPLASRTGAVSSAVFASNVGSSNATVSRTPMTAEETQRWRQGQSLRASEYGMEENKFKAVLENFTSFATRGDDGVPVLRFRDACRLLRYFNYPNHPDDVKSLFEAAHQTPSTGAVSFHALCLWVCLNQRNPQQWYGMPPAAYEQVLRVAQVLDEDQTGLFRLDQARFLAEQYFERDVQEQEWAGIERVLRDKDEDIRQYFQGSGGYSTLKRDGRSSGDTVRLPFHDILVTFRNHVNALKREQSTGESANRDSKFAERVVNMIRYYEPEALPSVNNTLNNFKGEEESLLQTLVAMYGPEPQIA